MKTLANLFLHQWVRTAWCKKKFHLYLIPSSIVKRTHTFLLHFFTLTVQALSLNRNPHRHSFIPKWKTFHRHSFIHHPSSLSLSLEPLSLFRCEPLSIKTPLQNLSMFLESPIASHFSLFFPYHNLCHALNLSLSPPLSVLRILVAQFIVWILTRNPLRKVSESQYPSLYIEFYVANFLILNFWVSDLGFLIYVFLQI